MTHRQKMFSWAALFVLIVGACLCGIFLYRDSNMTPPPDFPPKNVACFDAFMNGVENGYVDFEFPTFSMAAVRSFKCASTHGFEQYELHGTAADGSTFYVRRAAGGVAASGSDTYYDLCYLRNGEVIASDRFVGRVGVHASSSCAWIDGFPSAQPESVYEHAER